MGGFIDMAAAVDCSRQYVVNIHKGLQMSPGITQFNSHHPVFDSVPCNRFSGHVLPRLFIYVLSYSRAWSEM